VYFKVRNFLWKKVLRISPTTKFLNFAGKNFADDLFSKNLQEKTFADDIF